MAERCPCFFHFEDGGTGGTFALPKSRPAQIFPVP